MAQACFGCLGRAGLARRPVTCTYRGENIPCDECVAAKQTACSNSMTPGDFANYVATTVGSHFVVDHQSTSCSFIFSFCTYSLPRYAALRSQLYAVFALERSTALHYSLFLSQLRMRDYERTRFSELCRQFLQRTPAGVPPLSFEGTAALLASVTTPDTQLTDAEIAITDNLPSAATLLRRSLLDDGPSGHASSSRLASDARQSDSPRSPSPHRFVDLEATDVPEGQESDGITAEPDDVTEVVPAAVADPVLHGSDPADGDSGTSSSSESTSGEGEDDDDEDTDGSSSGDGSSSSDDEEERAGSATSDVRMSSPAAS